MPVSSAVIVETNWFASSGVLLLVSRSRYMNALTVSIPRFSVQYHKPIAIRIRVSQPPMCSSTNQPNRALRIMTTKYLPYCEGCIAIPPYRKKIYPLLSFRAQACFGHLHLAQIAQKHSHEEHRALQR